MVIFCTKTQYEILDNINFLKLLKYVVSQVIGFIEGKSAIHLARNFMGHHKNFTGQPFRATGYYVSTVGRDEMTLRELCITAEKWFASGEAIFQWSKISLVTAAILKPFDYLMYLHISGCGIPRQGDRLTARRP
jgi:hypothetical protein